MTKATALTPTVTLPFSGEELESVSGQRWRMRGGDAQAALAMSQQLGLPELMGRILAGRGVSVDQAEGFLKPTLREFLPDPFHLLDMEKAARRIAEAINAASGARARGGVFHDDLAGESARSADGGSVPPEIGIFGDYDVDGATSSALLMRYLRAFGIEPLVHIPDRMKEGYGPNTPALLALKERGAKLVITVDCGTMAFEPLAAAQAAGLDVIVVDHHKGDAQMPQAYAIVNPNRCDETSPHTQLSAVGVTFLLLVAVNKILRECFLAAAPDLSSPRLRGDEGGYSETRNAEESSTTKKIPPPPSRKREGVSSHIPDLMQWLDLVALGTICDVVPLSGANRALVAQGLKVMRARSNTGIAAAMDSAGLAEAPGTYHAGFIVGPRINAGGRVGKSDLGVRLLASDDAIEARAIADELSHFNAERKAIESLVLEQALEDAAALPASDCVLVVARAGWHAGVIGIVAGRLKEKFHKPVAVIALTGGIGKASARSVTGIDLGAAVIAATHSGLLIGGGGHAMAAGFTVAEDRIAPLRDFLNQHVALSASMLAGPRTLCIDGTVSLQGITPELVRLIEQAGPFGAGNPGVRLMLENVRVVNAGVVGEGHVRAILTDAAGPGSLKAMAFRSLGTPLGDALLNARGRVMRVAGQVRLNHWQGRETVDFFMDDAAF